MSITCGWVGWAVVVAYLCLGSSSEVIGGWVIILGSSFNCGGAFILRCITTHVEQLVGVANVNGIAGQIDL